ncbi:uncharacterized protein LOC101862292 [Aplysia californica]|uniref:Uncharacterized protein LOC101862292 n=1 Tax=Aplysia californica TaxID=6500 RepID=A0ABM0JZ35_APLCA|nr:uncharacterized protein LOC101862292 [Aplysia californica]
MTGGFSKVYEQWLKNSNHDDDDANDGDMDEETPYEDPEGIADLMDSDTTEDEDGGSLMNRSPFYERQWTDKSAELISDSAPILLDDDDEIFPSEKQQFEEEPPILEPVSAPTHDSKSSQSQHSLVSPPRSVVRNYSRESMVRSSEKKTMKTYSRKSRVEENAQSLNDCLKKSKESGNIFDKFSPFPAGVEDVPPPLIPSPEALRLHSESPTGVDQPATTSDREHPGCSPDFCAMEADSTSEISGDSVTSCNVRNKNPVAGDVVVECDSTCMLGGSPAIVSPSSVLNGESEVRDQGGGSGVEADAGSPAEQARGTTFVTELVRPDPVAASLETNESWCEQDASRDGSLPSLDHPPCSGVSDASFVPASPVVSVSPPAPPTSGSPCLQVSVETPMQDEPPVLSAIPAPITSHSRTSTKRHTIDSPYTYSSSGKRPHTFPSPKVEDEAPDLECSAPPLLPLMSETVITLTSPDGQSKSSSHKSSKQSSLSSRRGREQRRAKRHRHRRITVPSEDLTSDVSHLPEELQQFVLSTRQLSAMQSTLHTLVLTLFPQLKAEVSSMSPESLRFELFVKDMVESLQQGDDQKSEEHPPLTLTIKCEKDVGSYVDQMAGKAAQSSDASRNHSSSNSSPQCFVSNHSQRDEPALSSHLSTRSRRPTRQCTIREDPFTSEVIPQFSQLDLKSEEEGGGLLTLKPVRVCVQRTSSEHLHKFCCLCCDLLQLLLPELPVSLCNELSNSPSDLLTFIENVVASNQRERRKHLL